MESRTIIYVPNWVKFIALVILSLGFAIGVFFAFYFSRDGNDGLADYILVALSLAQIAISGLVVALVVFYSERELSIKALLGKTDIFLEESLLDGFRRIRIPTVGNAKGEPIEAIVLHEKGQTIAYYDLAYKSHVMKMMVSANVKQIVAIYYLPVSPTIDHTGLISKIEQTLDGAKSVGYQFDSYLQKQEFDEQEYWELRFKVEVEQTFLLDAPERLFWINDICELSRSLLIDSIRGGIIVRQIKENPA